jgi:hypothetical protein
MTDWLFAETPVNHLAQIDACQGCYEQYHTLRSALHSFDQAAEAMMPDDSYWAGYEASLRVKLAYDATPQRWWQAAWRWGWMVPATVGLALLLFAVLGLSRQAPAPGEPGEERVAAAKLRPRPNENETEGTKPDVRKPRTRRQPKSERQGPARLPEKKPYFLTDPNPLLALQMTEAEETWPTMKHLERAQILLRSFRNAPLVNNATFDLSYEKKSSRHLLYRNIVLRREAEMRGDWPLEEVLSRLEPLLLDIANLPARPMLDDVTPIKERIQKKEIVAQLQLYTTPVLVAALNE